MSGGGWLDKAAQPGASPGTPQLHRHKVTRRNQTNTHPRGAPACALTPSPRRRAARVWRAPALLVCLCCLCRACISRWGGGTVTAAQMKTGRGERADTRHVKRATRRFELIRGGSADRDCHKPGQLNGPAGVAPSF